MAVSGPTTRAWGLPVLWTPPGGVVSAEGSAGTEECELVELTAALCVCVLLLLIFGIVFYFYRHYRLFSYRLFLPRIHRFFYYSASKQMSHRTMDPEERKDDGARQIV